MLLESQYQKRLINRIKKQHPGAVVLKTDPTYIQGFPDWLVLIDQFWGTLEAKRSVNARTRPNQEHYVNLTNEMSFGRFVYPENEEEVLRDLQHALQSDW